jgi:hypothetical protein
MGAKNRLALHCYLEPLQHEVWHNVSAEEGVSLSGFLEALALDMREFPPADGGHPRWPGVIKAARKIDAQRRRRGGPS